MSKKLVVGVLRESRGRHEKRAPVTPADAGWLIKKGIKVEVESSKDRIFKDSEYKRAGALLVDRLKQASLVLGVKQPDINNIAKHRIYLVFSHTIKGQPENMPLLREFIKRGVTLIDYEKITDLHGRRLVHFGRFAGICGLVDSLHYLGRKLESRGVRNPFITIKPAHQYRSFNQIIRAMGEVDNIIQREGFDNRISPFIIGIIGHGNVSQGVQEILKLLNPIEIHSACMLKSIRHQKSIRNRIYKIVFLREERLRFKGRSEFYLKEYLRYPGRFESNIGIYLPYLNMLINASYWDKRYPRVVTREMIDRLSRGKNFQLEFIADISCDINGSIELTYKAATADNPVFSYIPREKRFIDGYEQEGMSILAVDNLPAELPRDSSRHFSSLIRDYVYQIAACGPKDIANHNAIPKEIQRAVVTQDARLTPGFSYLEKALKRVER